MKHSYLKKLLYVLLPILILATQTTVLSCKGNGKKNGKNEIVVTVDANGKADGSHRFSKIDDSNFYIDDIRYTAQNGDLIVSGYDEAFFKGEVSADSIFGRQLKDEAFYECKVLTSIVIPSSVTNIGVSSFSKCEKLTSITIPNNVTNIGETAFYNCSSMTSINFPEKLISIGKGAFYGCSALTVVKIPNGVTIIDDYTFGACTKLAYVTIPENVTTIGTCCFYNCESLKQVRMKAKTPPAIDFITFTHLGNATLSVPFGCKAAYESTQYWNGFQEIIEE